MLEEAFESVEIELRVDESKVSFSMGTGGGSTIDSAGELVA